MFRQQPLPDGWMDDPPASFDNRFTAPQSPEDVFDIVVDPAHEAAWFPDFRAATWQGGGPPGAGSRRDYRLSYLRLDEHFLVWERGRRLHFEVLASSLPLTRRFAEDYRFSPGPDGGTVVDWRVGFQPSAVTWALQPVLVPYFAHTFRVAARQLQAYLAGLDAAAAHTASAPPRRGASGR